MSVRQLWAHFGSTISSEPHRSLAAFLGHKPSAILLSNAGLPLLHHENCAEEEELDPNPHELELPDEYLQTELLIRSLAFWGWEPLVRAANACSEHQLLRQEKFDATLLPIRDAAHSAASEFIKSAASRERARQAAAACQRAYKPFEDDPDSSAAEITWYQLGAPWFAAETVAGDMSLSEWDGPGPPAASVTWGNRNSVWPQRAAHAAAYWSSHSEVRNAITEALINWTIRAMNL